MVSDTMQDRNAGEQGETDCIYVIYFAASTTNLQLYVPVRQEKTVIPVSKRMKTTLLPIVPFHIGTLSGC